LIFYIEIAGLKYKVEASEDFYIKDAKQYECAPSKDAVYITATEEDIEELKKDSDVEDFTDYALESCVLLGKVLVDCVKHNRMIIHGALIEYKGEGYFFVAQSGTGKTTHISLWKKYLGEQVTIINGDKPIFEFKEDIVGYGNPWCGKERYGCNKSVPLKAIVAIKRGTVNSIRKMDTRESIIKIFSSTICSIKEEITPYALKNIDKILKKVPVYEVTCDIYKEAFETSFNELVNSKQSV